MLTLDGVWQCADSIPARVPAPRHVRRSGVLRRPRPEANPLAEYFTNNVDGRLIDKWVHYFDIYHRHFAPFRNTKATVVEFGVYHGGSLQMWRDYFGPRAHIIGVDIDQRCATLGGRGIDIEIGDQADVDFLHRLAAKVGPIDVVIEDGGHENYQQLTTFREMWPAIKDGGVYLVEDLHTSYWTEYGGGYRRPGTFMEHAKTLLDSVNAWHSRDAHSFTVDEHTRSVRGMHVYDSVVVFDKATVEPPKRVTSGKPVRED